MSSFSGFAAWHWASRMSVDLVRLNYFFQATFGRAWMRSKSAPQQLHKAYNMLPKDILSPFSFTSHSSAGSPMC